MLMRVSVGIHKQDVDAAIQTYHMMSRKLFTHATPTLFNSGTPRPQMSSCFLLTMKEDSIEVRLQAMRVVPWPSFFFFFFFLSCVSCVSLTFFSLSVRF